MASWNVREVPQEEDRREGHGEEGQVQELRGGQEGQGEVQEEAGRAHHAQVIKQDGCLNIGVKNNSTRVHIYYISR